MNESNELLTKRQISAFIIYLNQLIPNVLDINQTNLNNLDKCLNKISNVKLIEKFLNESQTRTLVIQKLMSKIIYNKYI